MPKVEQYGESRVSTRVTQGARAQGLPSSSFTLAETASTVQDIAVQYDEFKLRADQASAQEALVSFERDKNALLFNPDNGYYNKQGKDAYDGASDTVKELEKLRHQYEGKLSSNRAKQLFGRAAEAHTARDSASIMTHASKGLQAWEIATTKAQVENSIENAALYWNDDKKLAVQREIGRQSVIEAGQREGVGNEVINERLQTYESSFARTAIESAILRGSSLGEDAMTKYEDRLEGHDLNKVTASIARKKEAERTQALAQQTVVQAQRIVSDNDSRKDIIEAANNIGDPELRSRTLKQSMFLYDQKRTALDEEREGIYQEVEKFAQANHSADVYQSIYPDRWAKLTPKQQNALKAGEAVQTDYAKMNDLLMLPDTELAKVQPSEYYDRLAPKDRNKLVSAVRTARGKEEGSNQTGRTRAAEIKSALTPIFGEQKSWGKDEIKRVNAFYSVLDAAIDERETLKGSPLSSEEFTQTLASLTRKTVVERDFWFDAKKDISDIPEDDMLRVTDYLRQNGLPITSDNIINVYEQAK